MEVTPDLIMKLEELMKSGATPVQVAARLGVSKTSLMKAVNNPNNTDLREAFERGMTFLEAAFELKGNDLISGEIKGAVPIWLKFMQKYFDGWTEKSEVKIDSPLKAMSDADLKRLAKETSGRLLNGSE